MRALWLLCCWVWLVPWAQAQTPAAVPATGPATAASQVCAARVLAVSAARAVEADGNDGSDGSPSARPVDGWKPVTLPDVWTRHWPEHSGSVWYRIDWAFSCPSTEGPPHEVALGIDGISVAGEVFSNHDRLWRDVSLQEPLSRSWNVPRWWVLPASGLTGDRNTVWVRAVGPAGLTPGLSRVRLGDAVTVAQQQAAAHWRQRTVYLINAVVCAVASTLFLGMGIWLTAIKRRGAEAGTYIWFGLMALAWLGYLCTYLAATQWPWPDSITRGRFGIWTLVMYVLSACLFTFRFGRQNLPRTEQVLWALAVVASCIVLFVPDAHSGRWFDALWQAVMGVLWLNAVQFQWHAWRPDAARTGTRGPQRVLAVCWLMMLAVPAAQFTRVLDSWQIARDWAAWSGILMIALVTLLLGAQLVRQIHQMERFSGLLAAGVARARADLGGALEREHSQMLDHAKLQERMRLAHDLHDGLGASLVRGMALMEGMGTAVPQDRVLSLLKTLRDDLRQVIDHGSSAGASVPDTPVQWMAPLRHRFARLFDVTGVHATWQIIPEWQGPPTALQCLMLVRLVEEALSNVVKHSGARQVRVECTQPQPGSLHVRIEDDGVGFDVQAVQQSGLSVGVRSMAARAERMGATLQITSSAQGTTVVVQTRVPEGDSDPAA